jgi:hypothetical protein
VPLNHYTFTVDSTTPTRLTPEGKEVGGSLTVHVQNFGNHDVFIGGEGLTSSSYGRHLNTGESISFENLTTVDEIYALAESGQSTTVAVIIVKR